MVNIFNILFERLHKRRACSLQISPNRNVIWTYKYVTFNRSTEWKSINSYYTFFSRSVKSRNTYYSLLLFALNVTRTCLWPSIGFNCLHMPRNCKVNGCIVPICSVNQALAHVIIVNSLDMTLNLRVLCACTFLPTSSEYSNGTLLP